MAFNTAEEFVSKAHEIHSYYCPSLESLTHFPVSSQHTHTHTHMHTHTHTHTHTHGHIHTHTDIHNYEMQKYTDIFTGPEDK